MKLNFSDALLKWYDENKRDLPWRKSQEPYSIWISEIMAQQTRITAVMPYYERFMKLFPTVQALAAADIDQVLKAWEGLGYYARAHNLQKAARKIVDEFDGQLPGDEKNLRSLPGIGAYTAGAILSISFGQPIPAVDGNVERVFTRFHNHDMDITLPATKAFLTQLVKEYIPEKRTGIFTQALMELGALICVPKNPSCGQCPVVSQCKAHALGRQGELPVKSPKRPLKHLNKTILLIMNPQDQVLMGQRKSKLLNGLWEFYSLEGKIEIPEIKKSLAVLGYTDAAIVPIGKAAHTFTHLVWEMQGYACLVKENIEPEGFCFVEKTALEALALPTALRFYVHWLEDQNKARPCGQA